MEDWDGNKGDCFVCDEVVEFFDNYYHYIRRTDEYGGKFYNQITCCIRAAFDLAVEPSGGVVGYTAGDLRRMWSGVAPEWVKEGWEVPFDDIPDNGPIWI